MVEVYVGIGSNIEPEVHLRLAVSELEERFGSVRCSNVFRSPAYGFSGDDFLNMVASFATSADPDAVEAVLSAIEYGEGRLRGGERFAARTLDLDLLLYGAMVDARRRLPRDDVSRYPFVLAPLAELVPDLAHPLTGRSMKEGWSRMEGKRPSLQSLGALADLR